MEKNSDKFLTIHGHFYQPPRENPWIEEIELQESAKPYHNWNDRISNECYEPNSVSRIADSNNCILEIVNNYELMSFNFGPTLLSWLEKYSKRTYDKIIEADKNSRLQHNNHSAAIAQVYNHMIMPLANDDDKETQVIWGIKDYIKRFGHKPEGIWLAETAVDDDTLEVLQKYGIKFTILSPFQAQCVRKMGENDWHDVSWGSIDPSMPYRYYIKDSNKTKYVDLFFYDGTISKSVAFDNLLKDGQKFAYRLNDGYDPNRNRPQLVNIATDGESYGHHTKFGDMALSYVLAVKAQELGFKLTNYGEFLEKFPPTYEVEVKRESSWSCCHGVNRWQEDCGCSTGGLPGWNQKWRAPLRKALDDLRNELIVICQIESIKYFKDFKKARNEYISVILDRSKENVEKFLNTYAVKKLNQKEKTKALKLLEIQRQAMLMYTSCGWFFAEISGIETVQIMKYAARAMELAKEFTNIKLEKKFLNTLSRANSNISSYGTGKDVYERFVKPAILTVEQLVGHYAIISLFSDLADLNQIFSYKFKKINHKTKKNKYGVLSTGRVEVTSSITLEKRDMVFAIVNEFEGQIYCLVEDFKNIEDFSHLRKEMEEMFSKGNEANILPHFKKYFKGDYFTLKDVLIDKRKILLEKIMYKKLKPLGETYKKIYKDMKASVSHLMDLGMDTPEVFRLAAKYTITSELEALLTGKSKFKEKDFVNKLTKLKIVADKFNVNLTKTNSGYIISRKIEDELINLAKTLCIKDAQEIVAIFEIVDLLDLNPNIRFAQNLYFENFYKKFDILIEHIKTSKNKSKDKQFMLSLMEIGKKLQINTEFYRPLLDKASLPR